MITPEIRRVLKGVFKNHTTAELDAAVKGIMSCFMSMDDYDAGSRNPVVKYTAYGARNKYSVIEYCPLDASVYEILLDTPDKEDALRQLILYKNSPFKAVDDQDVKIVNNETGQEYIGGNWYE